MEFFLVNTLIQNILFGKKWWLFRHLIFWLFIYLDEFLAFLGVTEPYDEPYYVLLSFFFDLVVVYFNIYVLFPKLLKKRRLAEYIGFTFLTIAALIVGEYLIQIFQYDEKDIPLSFFISVLVATSVTLSAAVAIKVLKEAFRENQLREEAEKQRLSFELKNLKKQVNPHFLFNVLNGIYIQSQTASKEVPNTIMQFSDLLRYQIYDAEKSEKVLLTKEIEFIENYIALEQMRRENTQVQFEHLISDKSFRIEPLLFLPLVENAFKYSIVSSAETSNIDLNLAQQNGSVLFAIDNTIGSISGNGNGESGGLGLGNLRKRLGLLYPQGHTLKIDDSKDGIFSVKLEISVNELHHSR